MPPISPKFIQRALLLDVVLTLVMITLSLISDQKLWSVIWGCGALVFVVDALAGARLLDLSDED